MYVKHNIKSFPPHHLAFKRKLYLDKDYLIMKRAIISTNHFRINLTLFNKKFFAGIILLLFSILLLLYGNGSPKAIFILCAILFALSIFTIEGTATICKILNCIWLLSAMPVTLFLTQLLMGEGIVQIGFFNIFLGIILIGIILLFIYICTTNPRATILFSVITLMILTSINFFVLKFRGSQLTPYDFLATQTALGVVSQYEYSITPPFAYAWVFTMMFCFVGFCFSNPPCRRDLKNTLFLVGTELLMIIVIVLELPHVSVQHFANDAAAVNGFLLNFIRQFETTQITKPQNYYIKDIQQHETKYLPATNEQPQQFPHVIMIMNESYADLRIIGDLKTNTEIMPFYDSLHKNTIKGYALASVFGGGTCNTEYEVITGNSMAFLPNGSYPYQQFLSTETYSIVSEFKKLGYTAIASHPQNPGNWMRSTVYPLFGFDKTYFLESYPQKDLLRGHVSDQEMYGQIIHWYESMPENERLFFFGVTMQNHSSYTYEGEDFTTTVQLEGYAHLYPDVEQYLTLIQHSDRALEYLITYFENIDEDVLIVFWGDHFPRIDTEFYKELLGSSFDTLEKQQLQYKVPFFIWANYDIEEKYIDCTSMNFLSNYLYEVAGIPLPMYNQFLRDVEKQIPAMNAFGYFSLADNRFKTYEEATGSEASLIEKYNHLVYNCLMDEEYKSRFFTLD